MKNTLLTTKLFNAYTKMHVYEQNVRRESRHQNIRKDREKKVRKFVILGTEGSGKFHLVDRFFGTTGKNREGRYTHRVAYKGYDLTIQLELISDSIDTQEKRSHIQTADVVIFTYASNSRASAQKVADFYASVREIREDRMPLVVVKTKSDLCCHQEDTEQLTIHGAKYITTSAKYNINVKDAFEYCLRNLVKKLHTYSMCEEINVTSKPTKRKRFIKSLLLNRC